jgi:hypothetical protein
MTWITPLLRSVHLASACFAAAAPMAAAWLHCRAARGDSQARHTGLWLVGWSLVSLALALVTGLLLGLLNYLGEENYSQLVIALRAKLEWGLAELAFSAILVCLFWKWWQRTPDLPRGKSMLRCSLAVLAGTNLLYHFPLLFAVLDQIRSNPELVENAITASIFRQLIVVPAVYTKALHVILAGVVLCCLAVMCAGEEEQQESSRLTTVAARVMLATLLLQLLIGIWMLMVMPADQRELLIGMGGVAPWLLALAVLLFVVVNQVLIPVAGGEKSGNRPRWLVGITLLLFLVMSAIAGLS